MVLLITLSTTAPYIFFFSTPWTQAEIDRAYYYCTHAEHGSNDSNNCNCFIDYVSDKMSYSNFVSGVNIGGVWGIGLQDILPRIKSAWDVLDDANDKCVSIVSPTDWLYQDSVARELKIEELRKKEPKKGTKMEFYFGSGEK